MNVQHQRLFRIALIAVYAAIPLAVALGTYLGWFFQSGKPSGGNSSVVTFGGVALLGATMFGEYAGVFPRPAGAREVLKAIGYWLAALVWVVVVVRSMPDNRAGAAILLGPASALMLAGMFHLSRFAGAFNRVWTHAIMNVSPVPMGHPISAVPSSQELPAGNNSEFTQVATVNIEANVWQIALRLVGGIAVLVMVAQLVRGTSYDALNRGIFYLGAVILGALAIRSLSSRGPALSLAADGIYLRRDLCAIRHLSWAQISGFEMKSSVGSAYLVIHVKDPDGLIAQCRPISRWLMNQSLAMFGSPVRIPTGWLKCDANWLWQKANEMLLASRGLRAGQ